MSTSCSPQTKGSTRGYLFPRGSFGGPGNHRDAVASPAREAACRPKVRTGTELLL